MGRRDGSNDAAAQRAAQQAGRVTSGPGRVTCQPGRVTPRLGNCKTVQYDPSATSQASPGIEAEIWEKDGKRLWKITSITATISEVWSILWRQSTNQIILDNGTTFSTFYKSLSSTFSSVIFIRYYRIHLCKSSIGMQQSVLYCILANDTQSVVQLQGTKYRIDACQLRKYKSTHKNSLNDLNYFHNLTLSTITNFHSA